MAADGTFRVEFRSRAPLCVVALTVLVAACGTPAAEHQSVAWAADRRVAGAVAPGATMVLLDGGVPAMQPAWAPLRWPDDTLACTGSFAGARGRGDTVFAVWRTGETGGATSVQVSRSANAGISWDSPRVITAGGPVTDGCSVPAPGIAADTVTGKAFVVYFASSPGRPGISIAAADRGAAGRGAPMLIAEGSRATLAAIAAHGDTLAVVFESPTAPEGVMWLAIFLGGSQIPPVRLALSSPGVRGYAPAVALGAGQVGAAWNEAGHGDTGSAAVARVGRFLK